MRENKFKDCTYSPTVFEYLLTVVNIQHRHYRICAAQINIGNYTTYSIYSPYTIDYWYLYNIIHKKNYRIIEF